MVPGLGWPSLRPRLLPAWGLLSFSGSSETLGEASFYRGENLQKYKTTKKSFP